MNNVYTAIIKQDGNWWIGWIEEVPGVNCQEATRDKLVESLKVTLQEALELNRQEALAAAGGSYQEERIAVWNGTNWSGTFVPTAANSCFFYHSLSETAIWFAGAGLSGIFVALLNMGLWPTDTSVFSRRLAAGANFLFFFWLVAGVSAIPGLPQAIVAGAGAAMVISAPLLGRPDKRWDEA
jgi:predicted RNase H-like HicB family nuclease